MFHSFMVIFPHNCFTHQQTYTNLNITLHVETTQKQVFVHASPCFTSFLTSLSCCYQFYLISNGSHGRWKGSSKKMFILPRNSDNEILVGAITILKNMSSSMGRFIPCIMELNNPAMFETTNQNQLLTRYEQTPRTQAESCHSSLIRISGWDGVVYHTGVPSHDGSPKTMAPWVSNGFNMLRDKKNGLT